MPVTPRELRSALFLSVLVLGAWAGMFWIRRDGQALMASRQAGRGGPPPALPDLPVAAEADWVTFTGDGFTLRHPPDAELVRESSHPAGLEGMAIRGPMVPAPRGPFEGPAYQLLVSDFPNPARLTTAAWVDSVRRERNAQEFDADSLGFLAPPDSSLTIAGAPALRLQPFCGDCDPHEIYIVGPRRAVVFSILYDRSLPGDRNAQRRLYDAMLATFRWTP